MPWKLKQHQAAPNPDTFQDVITTELERYKDSVLLYTKKFVEQRVEEELIGILPPTIEDGIKVIPHLITQALVLVNDRTDGAIVPSSKQDYGRNAFLPDLTVQLDWRPNSRLVLYTYSFEIYVPHPISRAEEGKIFSERYELDTRFWDPRPINLEEDEPKESTTNE